MPVIESTKRSLRKAVSNRAYNLKFKEAYKKLVKNFIAKPSADGLKKVFSWLDKGAKHNIFHKNKVARLKSQYSKKVQPAAKKTETKKETKSKMA